MIKETIDNNTLVATFDNGKNNTLDKKTIEDLEAIVKKANESKDIKGIVFTGEGRAFSAGFDLPMFLSFKNLDEVIEFFNWVEEVYINLFTCTKPVVAAINGAAVAGGMITAMACDYRIVKNHPKIMLGMSEIKIGLGLSVVQTEIMRFGFNSDRLFRDIMYWGQLFNVEKAKQLGVVDEVVEEPELLPRAKQVVSAWFDNPGGAFSFLKLTLRKEWEDRMRYRLKNENWQPNFNCFFDPGTRKALEMVMAMMGK